MFRLLLQELRFRRNGIIGWAIGISLLPAMYVGIYPQFADQLAGFEDLQIYKSLGMSFGNFEEWVASTVILIVPIIVSIYALIDGTGTLAGEEDQGKLELIAALPLPRWQIVTVKAIAHGIALFLILFIVAVVTAVVFLSIESQVETTLGAGDILLSVLYTWPLVMAFGMISLFLGAFAPRRRIAALIATVIVVASYFVNNLAGQVTALEALKPLSLFHHLNASADFLLEGPEASGMLVLLGVALVAFVLALVSFQRRNLTVGAWPWQRGRIPEGVAGE